jgi:meso-butanediol dehydrogenase/(S,S)-butanediol dehydrogenase/diacetyl reductase
MSGRLEGKVAIITGGGVGIGAAIAKAYVAEGAKVLISGRREEKLKEFAATQPEGSVAVFAGDITKVEDAEAMVEAAVKEFGKLNILVNNAGIDPAGNVTDIPIQQWHDIINTNINGTFYMTRFSVKKMLEQGGGSVISLSSLAGVRAIPDMPAYSTAKAGLVGFTNACALDYGKDNIRFNIISPGATATDMLKNQMQGLADAQNTDVYGALGLLTRFLPLARACEPDDIGPLAVFLGSDESSYITGQNILIDGGATVVDPNGASVGSLGSTWGG